MNKIIVTSGPTREFIDPIRFLSNPSSGRMGHAIATAAQKIGYKVVYISGPVSNEFSKVEGAINISVISTQDMLNAVVEHIKNKSILIMAAAPADYKPEIRFQNKIKKVDSTSIKFIPNQDILCKVEDLTKSQKITLYKVGFAAETNDFKKNALKKLKEKDLDFIFLNDLTRSDSGFGVDTNCLSLFRRDGSCEDWPKMSKIEAGHRIIVEIGKLIDSLSD